METVYAVPDFDLLELPKLSRRKLRSKSVLWLKQHFGFQQEHFLDKRCENLDMVATYRPYHFSGERFGLYVYLQYFASFFIHILAKTRLPFVEAHAFALECIISHGAFHYLVERYAELCRQLHVQAGSQANPSPYLKYKTEIYSPLWGTETCWEETLANHYLFQNHPEWDETRRQYVNALFRLQRDGYAQAAQLSPQKLAHVYRRLEHSVSCLGMISLEEWVGQNTPFPVEQLPVYLVNDGQIEAEFEDMLAIFFPGCNELEPTFVSVYSE